MPLLRTCVRSASGMLVAAVAFAGAQPGSAYEPTPVQMPSDAQTDVGNPTLSYTGRYVAHRAQREGTGPLQQQVRRTDLSTGASELLNPAVGGGLAPGNYSLTNVISSNGARVAFTTTAAQLVAGDDNDRNDAFVRDASSNTTFLASVAFDGSAANGATGMASLSRNGRYVVFTSTATDIVPGSTTTNSDVYRRDLETGTTVQVTVRPNGSPSIGPGAQSTDVSSNGNLVAFNSYNTDLAQADGADGKTDLFIRNMTTGTTRWLSSDVPAEANPSGVVISPNGRWVSTRWDNDGSLHLTRVSTGVTSTVATEGFAELGSFSSDLGRFVFMSGGKPYVRDLATGVNTEIPVPDGGLAHGVSISGNGLFAAYGWTPDAGGPSLIFRVAL
jgi:hypothetical protein